MELIPLRALNEYTYCPRLFHLMYVQGIFIPSPDTLEGDFQHSRAESRKIRAKEQKVSSEEEETASSDEDATIWNALPKELYMSDEKLGLIGKLDAIHIENEGFCPVESKHGPSPKGNSPFMVEGIELSSGA